ncbi:hypothetical protein SNE40_014119 [Patella caerulea]|uniref:Uncharacterized protein n=1 Tax=Patella caerulea TaxID=87958 RepID=A0AAN8JCZ7_PATCE
MWWCKDRTLKGDSDENDMPLSHLLRKGGKNQTSDDSDNCSIDQNYEASSLYSEDSTGLCDFGISKGNIFDACPYLPYNDGTLIFHSRMSL